MPIASTRKLAGVFALTLGLTLGACSGGGGMPINRGLESVNQPIVSRTNYTLDISAGSGSISYAEQQRLDNWFDAMDLRYGDRVAIDDPMMNSGTREAIAKLAGRRGILLQDGAPVTGGRILPGDVRVVLTRSAASVPNCPNWEGNSGMNYSNATSTGYGCSVNANLAAMVANPEDLIKGQEGNGETIVSTSNKAITSYRKQAPTGEGGLKKSPTGGGN